MKPAVRDTLLVVLVAGASFLPALGETRLWDQDEAYFAGAAAEMHRAGDWVTPRFNGEMFGHKPPLMYWAMMIGYRLFGENHFAERIGSALCGIGTAVLVYQFGCRFFTRRAGLWAGISIGSCLMFTVISRAAVADGYLTFFSALGIYLLLDTETNTAAANEQPDRSIRFTRSWLRTVAGYAAFGVATLAKGPIGLLMPMAVIGLFLMITAPAINNAPITSWSERFTLWRRRLGPLNFFRQFMIMRPFTAIAAVLLTAGVWFAMVGWATNGAFLEEFFGAHYLNRFGGAMDNHSGPFYYYLLALLIGVFPWSVFTIPALGVWRKQLASSGRDGAILLACWLVIYLIPFSLAATKLPHYILPCYPAVALLIGCWFDAWLGDQEAAPGWNWRAGMIALTAAATLLFAVPFALPNFAFTNTLLEQDKIAAGIAAALPTLGAAGGVLLLSGLSIWIAAELRQKRVAATLFATIAPVYMFGLFAILAPQIDVHQTSPNLAAEAHRTIGDAARPVATFQYFRPSLTYYFRQPISALNAPEDAAAHFAAADDALMIVPADRWKTLQAELPTGLTVLATTPRFPEGGDVYLIGRPSVIAKQPGATTLR